MGPMVWELDGPGPILKNSSICVMIGPLDRCTTARSGERGKVSGAGSLLAATVASSGLEQPVRIAAAGARTAAPISRRRLMGAGLSFLTVGEHGSQPVL